MVNCLLELLKVLSEGFGGEGTAIVCYKLERNDSRIKAQLEKFIQGFESLVGVEKGLTDYNDVTGCMIEIIARFGKFCRRTDVAEQNVLTMQNSQMTVAV